MTLDYLICLLTDSQWYFSHVTVADALAFDDANEVNKILKRSPGKDDERSNYVKKYYFLED